MKDFAKSIRTNNSLVCNKATVLKDGNVWVVLYANETKSQEFETEEEAREFAKKVGNSKVGNYIMNVMDQANEYSKGFSEALKKGDRAEAEKFSGYAKILKRQIKEERDEIQKRLKDFDNAERIMGAVGNRKVTNSAVREYKDREGRIAQIDFNEDGTDADMSIYEDERMTRAVESKNFSTIRDAEQYVQSHGFRRVG